ncbi:hypothetical protein N7532_003220 [Penicillium argentinense]|uniref:Uncharacterized protein n=1 Tax=Penicillium argentinense TaxID=1131581 RepID=A0A9W9KEA8_9EURO|nr:uncharacterized protein N7532_003220 [Penicillium argentinense]KAJ5102691.1 hypothetical protein N7532_003220 [Penicillium argentinense]
MQQSLIILVNIPDTVIAWKLRFKLFFIWQCYEDKMMDPKLRGRALMASILITSDFDFTLFGYDPGVFGGILAGQRLQDTLGNPGSTMTGLQTAIYDFRCAFGALAAFIWSEKLSWRKSIIVTNIICHHRGSNPDRILRLLAMFVSRIIADIGIGLSTVVVPILQPETPPAHNSGSLLAVQGALFFSDRTWIRDYALPHCMQIALCNGVSLLRARSYSVTSHSALGAELILGETWLIWRLVLLSWYWFCVFEWEMADGAVEDKFGQFERIMSNPTHIYVNAKSLSLCE